MFTAIRRAFSFYPSQDGEFTLNARGETTQSDGWDAHIITAKFQVTLKVTKGDLLWANRKVMGLPMKRYVTAHLNDALNGMANNCDLKSKPHGEVLAHLTVAKGDFLAGMGLRILRVRHA